MNYNLIIQFSSGSTEEKVEWIRTLDISDLKMMINYIKNVMSSAMFSDSYKEYYINICQEEYTKKIINNRNSKIDDLFNL